MLAIQIYHIEICSLEINTRGKYSFDIKGFPTLIFDLYRTGDNGKIIENGVIQSYLSTRQGVLAEDFKSFCLVFICVGCRLTGDFILSVVYLMGIVSDIGATSAVGCAYLKCGRAIVTASVAGIFKGLAIKGEAAVGLCGMGRKSRHALGIFKIS
jgi:hypothetical protein